MKFFIKKALISAVMFYFPYLDVMVVSICVSILVNWLFNMRAKKKKKS